MKQMRQWVRSFQPQFLLTALLLGMYQLRGSVGKEWKARFLWLEEERRQFLGKPAQGGWEHTAFDLKLHCKVIVFAVG